MVAMSILLSLILCIAICYKYFHQSVQYFYASNGITEPMELDPLDVPNALASPLLPPDPMMSDQTKLIPE